MRDEYFSNDNHNTMPASRPSSRQVRKRSSFFTVPKKSFHRHQHHYSEDSSSSMRSTSSSRLGNHAIKEEEPEDQLHFSFSKMYLMNPRLRKTPSRLQMHAATGSIDEEGGDSRAPSRQEIPQSRSTPNFHRLLRQDSNSRLRGKPISSPFHFKHLSHVDSTSISTLDRSNNVELEKGWEKAIRQPTPSPTTTNSRPSVPPTPQSGTFNRLPIRTDGLMPSPSLDSAYSPVESMADLNRSSTRSIDSLANLFPSHLSPPPRTSSRMALRGAYEESTPRESMIRESIIILQGTDELPSPPISPRRRSSFVPHQSDILPDIPDEEDELVSPLSPPARSNFAHGHHRTQSGSRPDTSSSQDSSSGLFLTTFKPSPEIVVNNNLLVPPAAVRPASQASDTLGLSTGHAATGMPLPPVLEQPPAAKKRMSKALQRNGTIKTDAKSSSIEEGGDFASWEDDIDWSYDQEVEASDNEGNEDSVLRDSTGAVADLTALFPNPPITKSSSAPTSASASAVNLAALISSPPTQALPALPTSPPMSPPVTTQIGVADGGFGVFDESDYDYSSKVPHHEKMKMRAVRAANHIRSLSSFSSLPEGHMRKRYKNPQFQEFPSLNEKEELPASSFRRAPAGPREVAIPPASYFQAVVEAKEAELQGRRSRAASNATCATLVSDTDTALLSDIDSILTPPHSNHNSAESSFLSKHASSLRFSGKDQHTSLLSPTSIAVLGNDGVQTIPASLRPDADFNFF